MATAHITQAKIEIGEQLIWSSGHSSLLIATITQETEKAVKIDYTLESVWSNGSVVVFTRTAWIPKSAIINDPETGGLTIKPWLRNKFEGGPKIKPYFIKAGQKIYA